MLPTFIVKCLGEALNYGGMVTIMRMVEIFALTCHSYVILNESDEGDIFKETSTVSIIVHNFRAVPISSHWRCRAKISESKFGSPNILLTCSKENQVVSISFQNNGSTFNLRISKQWPKAMAFTQWVLYLNEHYVW